MTTYPIEKLCFYANGVKMMFTGTRNKNGVWLNDVKNVHEGHEKFGVHAKNLTETKIMKNMSQEEKNEYVKKFK
jgi:hypothetical protein